MCTKRMSSNKLDKNSFAVVEFKADPNEPHKRLVEVIKYSWLTDEGDTCFCPKSKNWCYELKNHGLPREDWAKYACRVLKYNIATIKEANIECSKRLNYTTSELSDNETAEPTKKNDNFNETSVILNYDDLFDKIDKEYIITPPSVIPNDKCDINEIITETSSANNVICVQYDSLQIVLQELAELKKSHGILLLKADQTQSNLEKILAQNEIISKIQMESYKKSPNESSFVPVTNIDSKQKLDDLEIQLGHEEFFQNMAYSYTQYAFKGDAKKEVNGFTKSILLKLLDESFSQQLKWDRIKKLEENVPVDEDDFLTDVDM